jgi:hypothetical protein
LSIGYRKLVIADWFFRNPITYDGFPISFLENSFAMEDFSLALLEDGHELGISHGSWGKLISNEGFSLWDQNFDRGGEISGRSRNTPKGNRTLLKLK